MTNPVIFRTFDDIGYVPRYESGMRAAFVTRYETLGGVTTVTLPTEAQRGSESIVRWCENAYNAILLPRGVGRWASRTARRMHSTRRIRRHREARSGRSALLEGAATLRSEQTWNQDPSHHRPQTQRIAGPEWAGSRAESSSMCRWNGSLCFSLSPVKRTDAADGL